MVESIVYEKQKLKILNQLKLPFSVEYDSVESVRDGWHAIAEMRVRGAPAIAIVAVLCIAVELSAQTVINQLNASKDSLLAFVKSQCDYLCTSRPTAVNVKKECHQLTQLAHRLNSDSSVSFESMRQELIDYAANVLRDDVAVNRAIGHNGAQHIIESKQSNRHSLSVLTHCNTGSLATAGYGTALGVIRSLHSSASLRHAYCTETRPYNQGSRLTSWELVADKIPSTLICDNMVAALMKQKSIDAVVVGADRVVANGDTANKIGTYQIAILAKYHSVPFYVASPKSTIDMNLANGDHIPIEERPADEMKCINGIPIATPEINCWNPAFDVTPAHLITGGIITEFGVFPPNQLKNIFNANS